MSLRFNYRHLYYFWVVAREGGISRAAARLGMAVQTVSAQVRELERALGQQLLRPAGRGLTLTEAGQAALRQAEQIFQLGEQLPELVKRSAKASAGVRLVVGLSDGLPKLMVRHLMEPVLQVQELRLVCHEDEFDDLLADLALHRLDVVLADRGPPPNPNLKLYGHALGSSPVAWYAPASLAAVAQRGFPGSLAELPVLLPSHHAAVRLRIDQWFERHALHPRVVGEFEDSALLKTFAAGGMGVFPAASRVHDDLVRRYRVRRIGECEGVEEHFFAIGTERRVQHPLVSRLVG
ncbi:MAG: LysR family transcriptional regulator [Burkholderiaceae bacterium]|nr:LysR family transcriptional regulator [Burkholderiaceae bacterium]